MNYEVKETADQIVDILISKYAICNDCAAEKRARALVETDSVERRWLTSAADFHEARADVILEILKQLAGYDEDTVSGWINA